MRIFGIALFASSLTAAREASAVETVYKEDELDTALERAPAPERERNERYSSPQWFAFELRVGTYLPNVDDDSSLGGRKPFEQSFGKDLRFMAGLEFDVQPLRLKKVGSLGIGAGAALCDISESTLLIDKQGNLGKDSAGKNSLTVYPFHLVVVGRLDVLRDKLKIPVVPYAKAGFSMAYWRASNLGGTASNQLAGEKDAVSGKGTTWGTFLAAGLAFDIGALDTHAAYNIDETTGINHTYIFGEILNYGLSGFGDKQLNLSDTTWNAGLALEF